MKTRVNRDDENYILVEDPISHRKFYAKKEDLMNFSDRFWEMIRITEKCKETYKRSKELREKLES